MRSWQFEDEEAADNTGDSFAQILAAVAVALTLKKSVLLNSDFDQSFQSSGAHVSMRLVSQDDASQDDASLFFDSLYCLTFAASSSRHFD
jgi:hypothetical protein